MEPTEAFNLLSTLDDKELTEASRQAQRQACMNSLYYLTKHVLGYHELSPRIHLPLCNLIQSVNPFIMQVSRGERPTPKLAFNDKDILPSIRHFYEFDEEAKTRLFLMFRGSFKSTIITIAHSIQLMLLWPDIRILIASHKKEDGSEPLVQAMRHHFIRNQRFRWLFPEYCPQANKQGQVEWGAKDTILLPNRSDKAAFPELTVETAGMTTDLTGRHYDYIKKDDLVTKDSVSNETMLQKTRYFDSLTRFLFVQPEWGITDYVGTPYHFNDIYAMLRKAKGVSKVVIPIYDDKGCITFPERFTDKGIEAIRNSPDMTSFSFSAQYMLNPVPTEDQDFRPEWFEGLDFHYDSEPTNLRKYLFVDPANKRSRKSDYTAIVVLGIDENDVIYLLDAIRDKLNVEDRTTAVIDKAVEHGLKKIHYEAIGFQDTDCYIIGKKCRERGIWLDIEEVKHGNTSKEDRIRSLIPIFQRRRIRWPQKLSYYSKYEKKTFDMLELLYDELTMFPKVEHDDLIDCMSTISQIKTYAADKKKSNPKDDEFMRARQLAIDAKQPKPFLGFGKKRVLRGIPAIKGWGKI